MHYCLMFLSKDFPTDDVIDAALKPFSDEVVYKDADEDGTNVIYPVFTWDWWQIGGRYNGKLKLKYDPEADGRYKWRFMAKEPRTGRLFRSFLLEKIQKMDKSPFFFEEDYFGSMGARDGYLYVDAAPMVDLVNFDCTNCFCFLDIDGTAYARSSWNGNDFVDYDDFDTKIKDICKDRNDCYVAIIDIHD